MNPPLSDTPIFADFSARYLAHPDVRSWLLSRTPEPSPSASCFASSVSFACTYDIPPALRLPSPSAPPPPGVGRKRARPDGTSSPRRRRTASAASTFLQAGDLMLFQRMYGKFAVGRLYNARQNHSLAQLRESVGRTGLSTRVVVRHFAVDLSADAVEVMEFAWMTDESLIVNCRRLRPPIDGVQVEGRLAMNGDVLFFGVQGGASLFPGLPFRTLSMFERLFSCARCGSFQPRLCCCEGGGTWRGGAEDGRGGGASSVTEAIYAENVGGSAKVLRQEVRSLANFTSRMHNIDQSGSVFARWFKRVPSSTTMQAFYETDLPIPYRVVSGSRQQTADLSCMFIADVNVYPDAGIRNDTVLYGSLTSGGGNLDVVLSNHDTDYDFESAVQSSNAVCAGNSHTFGGIQPAAASLPGQSHGGRSRLGPFLDDSSARVVAQGAFTQGATIRDAQVLNGPELFTQQQQQQPTAPPDFLPYGVVSNFTSDVALAGASSFLASRGTSRFQTSVSANNSSRTDSNIASEERYSANARLPLASHQLLPHSESDLVPLPLAPAISTIVGQDNTVVSDDSRKEHGNGGDFDSSGGADVRILTNALTGEISCSACGVTSKKSGNLRRHISSVHEKKRYGYYFRHSSVFYRGLMRGLTNQFFFFFSFLLDLLPVICAMPYVNVVPILLYSA